MNTTRPDVPECNSPICIHIRPKGKRVRLEYDQGTGRNDRYGRTLAYVYLANGTLLNLEIIERGYGHAYTRFPPRGPMGERSG